MARECNGWGRPLSGLERDIRGPIRTDSRAAWRRPRAPVAGRAVSRGGRGGVESAMLECMVVPASLRPRVLRPASPRTAGQSARVPAAPLADPGTFPPLDPQRRPWAGREITSGGVTLHVRETPGPDGCRAVYVHGLGGSSLNWTDLAALLGARAAGAAVDLPGFGRSTPPAGFDFSPVCLLYTSPSPRD